VTFSPNNFGFRGKLRYHYTVDGVPQWLGRRSLAGGLSLIYARSIIIIIIIIINTLNVA